MLRTILALFIALFGAAHPAFSTTHIAYYDGTNVYVGSDSKRGLIPVGPVAPGSQYKVACKVIARNQIVAIFSGKTSVSFIVHGRDGVDRQTSRFEIHLRVADILAKQESMDQKFSEVQEKAFETLTNIYHAERNHPPPSLARFNIEITIIAFDNGIPKLWMVYVGITDWAKGPDKPRIVANATPLSPEHPLLATTPSDPAYAKFRSPEMQRLYKGRPIEFVRAFLDHEAIFNMDDVGRPYSIVELSPGLTHPKLLEGREFCSEDYVPN